MIKDDILRGLKPLGITSNNVDDSKQGGASVAASAQYETTTSMRMVELILHIIPRAASIPEEICNDDNDNFYDYSQL